MRHSGRKLLGLLCACALGGCEILADFDSSDEVEGRTIPPTPITMMDGAMPPLVPDGSVRDGAVLTGRDAGLTVDAAALPVDASAPPSPNP